MKETRCEAVPPEQRDRIRSIDGLRSLALLLVFGYHTWEFAGQPRIPVLTDIVSQNTRPDFFVVLSGFVLFLPFARNPHRIDLLAPVRYVRRRARRIVLPYYAALLLAVLLPQALVVMVRIVGGEAAWQDWPEAGDWVTHLTFTHLFFPQYWDGINGSLWTMSLEMQLYLVFPVLLLLFSRFGGRALVGALAMSVTYRLIVGGTGGRTGVPGRVPRRSLGLGPDGRVPGGDRGRAVDGAMAWEGGRCRAAFLLVGLTVAGYLLSVSPLGGVAWLGIRELALALAFGSLVALAVTFRPVESLFAARPAAWLGFHAYSLFLVHQPVAWYVSEFLTKYLGIQDGIVKLLLLWTVGFAAVLAVGMVLFVAVERPCIAWAKRMPVIRDRSVPADRTDEGALARRALPSHAAEGLSDGVGSGGGDPA